MLYIINLNYAQRIMRAYHPKFGHSKPVKWIFLAYYLSLIAVLIMVITATILLFYTLNMNILRISKDIQHFALVYLAVFCFMPFPIVLISRWTSRRENKARFGKLGTLTHQVIIVLVAATLLLIEAMFRTVTTLLPAHLITNPPWYDKRAAYYCFLPTIEVLVVLLYAVTRVDQRFFIEGKAERLREAQKESQMNNEH
jgi:amino acid transporter